MTNYSLKGFIPRLINKDFAPERRRYQGIPTLEVLPSGRMLAVYYAGELPHEGPGNYVVLACSDDRGLSWSEIQVVAPVEKDERAFDPVLWLDPIGRLWWIWSQCVTQGVHDIFDGRNGVWAAVCKNPDASTLKWSRPRRLAEGVQMCKPALMADGTWVFPVALWNYWPEKVAPEFKTLARSNLLLSRDQGKSFTLVPGPDVPERVFDEHMFIEHPDGSWEVFARTAYGIGKSSSADQGKTWSRGCDSGLGGPSSRFVLSRLRSGKLLLINNETPQLLPGEKRKGWVRQKLIAWLSDDEGASWYGRLVFETRENVSYPDMAEGKDGFLYVIYDRERSSYGEILIARFTEMDVAAGTFITPGCYFGLIVTAYPMMLK